MKKILIGALWAVLIAVPAFSAGITGYPNVTPGATHEYLVEAPGGVTQNVTQAELDSRYEPVGAVATAIAGHVNAADPHPQYQLESGMATAVPANEDDAAALAAIAALTAGSVGAEPALGNPAANGYVLSSTALGVRSWVAGGTGTGDDLGDATALDVATLFSGVGDYLKSDGTRGTPSGGGAVDSVNGATGVVVLDASDVGADATGTASAAVSAHAGAADPHTGYQLESSMATAVPANEDDAAALAAIAALDADDIADSATKIIPTATQEGNWDTAYGWGNHAGTYLTLAAAGTAATEDTGTTIGTIPLIIDDGAGNASLPFSEIDDTATNGDTDVTWSADKIYDELQLVSGGTDDQTIDVFSLTGTTLNLSLEDDGEETQTVDLSSLQDGTGTDDQTAAEVSYSNTTSGLTATDTQAAIDEIVADGITADDTAYAVSWDGNTDAATKNALYDKIETLSAGSAPTIQSADPDSESSVGFYGATTSGDFFYRTSDGLFNISSGTFTGTDSTPTAFSFTDQTDVAVSTTITSAAITVAGINTDAAISVTGGTYDINASGTFTADAGTVSLNDTVRARHTSSASNSTATDTVVTIGGVSDTFTSTTLAATAPTLSSATLGTDGGTLTLVFSEAITQGSGYNNNQFNLDASVTGNDIALTYSSGDTTDTHVYTAASTINSGETVDFDFDGTADSMEDSAGDDLAAIASASVTNNSTQSGGVVATHISFINRDQYSGAELSFAVYDEDRNLLADTDTWTGPGGLNTAYTVQTVALNTSVELVSGETYYLVQYNETAFPSTASLTDGTAWAIYRDTSVSSLPETLPTGDNQGSTEPYLALKDSNGDVVLGPTDHTDYTTDVSQPACIFWSGAGYEMP